MVVTDRPPESRNALTHWPLLAVLGLALALRLWGVGFGLPALNDPDEPLFMMTAFEMLAKPSLDPGWFGHPATVTFYCLALVTLAVAVFGVASGRFDGIEAFGKAVYLDPGMVWLPARMLIVVFGVICVLLVYRLGKRLGDARLGLVAALFLAVNALHIEYSQIIRTDVQAGLFMLLAVLSALAILGEGRRRDYVLAGVWVGLACATKWPAALIAASPLCAGLVRREWRGLALLCAVAAATLIVVSPYLLIEWRTVLANLSSEARPHHPGATGGSFLYNLRWYASGPLLASLGWGGLLLALAGTVWPWAQARRRGWAVAVLPGCLLYLAAVCGQSLVWERWIVPLLPFAALAAARALCALADRVREDRWAVPLAAALLCLPMLAAAQAGVTERTHDTRQAAAAWVRAHVPADRTIVIEHAGFDMLQGPWRFRFPLGSAGCVDARAALTGRIRYSEVEKKRAGSPIVDLGHVAPALLASCRADFAVITHYDRYRSDPQVYAAELASYRRILRGGRERAVFRPDDGHKAGPIVRIVELPRLR